MSSLIDEAESLASVLIARNKRIVFAESCTAGLVSATLARTPGISVHHCGSAVTYRERTKHDWLGVTKDDLEKFTAVSEPVARQMAIGVLDRTLEADFAASVTGHLGPDAPRDFDGVVYISVARRVADYIEIVNVWRHVLKASTRHERQEEAAEHVFRRLHETLMDVE